MTTYRQRDPGQPVKDGADPSGRLLPSLTAGNDAPTHHGPRDNQGASTPGGAPPRHPPEQQTLAGQRRRALTPPESQPLGVSEHNRRSRGRCGWTRFLQNSKRPAEGKAVWAKCQARGCPDCGPEIRERNLAHDLANMADRQMIRRVVARSAWPALRAKIKRAGGLRVVYPQPGGMLAVYATAGSMTGQVVMDAPAQLATDYEAIPRGESIRRSSEWAMNPKVKAAGGPSWTSLGTSTVTERVPAILRTLGLYRGEVDQGAVPLEAWEVHNFTVPELDTSAFDRFAFAVGLDRSAPRRRRRKAVAA